MNHFTTEFYVNHIVSKTIRHTERRTFSKPQVIFHERWEDFMEAKDIKVNEMSTTVCDCDKLIVLLVRQNNVHDCGDGITTRSTQYWVHVWKK